MLSDKLSIPDYREILKEEEKPKGKIVERQKKKKKDSQEDVDPTCRTNLGLKGAPKPGACFKKRNFKFQKPLFKSRF